MYQIFNNRNGIVEYSGGWSMSHNKCRVATAAEVKAFNQGCRHIKDIKKYKTETYAIY